MHRRGLTLIEVLVVIAISAVIMGASLPAYSRLRQRAMASRTRTMIISLEAALSMYGSDFGDYPVSSGDGSSPLVELLQGPVESHAWRGPYMMFKLEDIDEEGNILDAWNNPLVYLYPQNRYENVPYIIVSGGHDREFDTLNDIGNW